MKVLLISPLPPPVGGIATWTNNVLYYYISNDQNIEILLLNTALKFRNVTNTNFIYRYLRV